MAEPIVKAIYPALKSHHVLIKNTDLQMESKMTQDWSLVRKDVLKMEKHGMRRMKYVIILVIKMNITLMRHTALKMMIIK